MSGDATSYADEAVVSQEEVSLSSFLARPRVQASPGSLRCVLEQDTLILAQYWFNPGKPVPT